MVGLSLLLENQRHHGGGNCNKKSPQVINKATVMINNKPSPFSSFSSSSSSSLTNTTNSYSTFPVTTFLQHCFLCKQTLLPSEDIYMYQGDRAFCSVECRCRQIFVDEEEDLKKENCSLAAMNPRSTSSASASASASRSRKGTRNRAGGFAY